MRPCRKIRSQMRKNCKFYLSEICLNLFFVFYIEFYMYRRSQMEKLPTDADYTHDKSRVFRGQSSSQAATCSSSNTNIGKKGEGSASFSKHPNRDSCGGKISGERSETEKAQNRAMNAPESRPSVRSNRKSRRPKKRRGSREPNM